MNAVPATALGEAGSWNRSRQRRRRGPCSLALATPAALQQPPFGARQQILLDRAQDRQKAVVALQPFDILDTVAARKVEENHRQRHLNVEPALAAGRPQMPPDRRREAAGLDKLEIQRETGKRRQAVGGRLSLVLEIEQALCHYRAPPWGWALIRTPR